MHSWHIYSEFEQASKAAADFLVEHIKKNIRKKDSCHVVLPGGKSPARCLSYLLQAALPWHKIHWYLGDERCYPAGHAERNDVMLQNNLWSHIDKPVIHRIPAEQGAEAAAAIYREEISVIKKFDIVFLGMGEDGHTASLFPHNAALEDTRSVVPVYNSPKAPDSRVSLSINTLRKAQCRMVLTGGVEKADVIKQIKEKAPLPVNCIGDINWFIDEAVAGAIS